MDDFVLLHHDKDYLRKCLGEIRNMCECELKLELNEKTQIFPVKNGVDYLGWHLYLTDSGKVVRKLRNSNKKSMKKRFGRMMRDYSTYKIDFDAVKRSTTSTYGHLAHGHTYKLRSKLAQETVYVRQLGAEPPH